MGAGVGNPTASPIRGLRATGAGSWPRPSPTKARSRGFALAGRCASSPPPCLCCPHSLRGAPAVPWVLRGAPGPGAQLRGWGPVWVPHKDQGAVTPCVDSCLQSSDTWKESGTGQLKEVLGGPDSETDITETTRRRPSRRQELLRGWSSTVWGTSTAAICPGRCDRGFKHRHHVV